MKQISFVIAFVVLLFWNDAIASFTYSSTCGYQIRVDIIPTQVITSNGNNCPNGYNYDIKFFYNITVIGNIPDGYCGGAPGGALFNAQVEIYCNNKNSGGYNLPKRNGSGYATTTTNQWVPSSSRDMYNAPYVHCREANVDNFNCNKIKIILSGPGLTVNEIESITPVLPLGDNLSLFDVTKLDRKKAKLVWQVVNKSNYNAYYIHHFNENGALVNDYIFQAKEVIKADNTFTVDLESIAGETNYYTILAIDNEGNSVNLGTRSYENNADVNLNVYPNPVTNGPLNISLSGNQGNISEVLVYNLIGQQLAHHTYSAFQNEVSIALPYQGEQFIVEIKADNGEVWREKVLKQNK